MIIYLIEEYYWIVEFVSCVKLVTNQYL